MSRVVLVMLASSLACRAASLPLPAAGARGDHNTSADDGAGALAHQSIQLSIDTTDGRGSGTHATRTDLVPPEFRKDAEPAPDPALGGATYGGRAYAGWHAPAITTPASRVPRYTVVAELHGAIEGTVTWGGPLPGKLTTACGAIDNPSVRLGANRTLAGALVYIERVSVGRGINQNANHAPPVGGAVIKRGCALLPTLQVATPTPVQLAIDVDTHARVVVTSSAVAGATPTTGKSIAIQDGGRALVTLPIGPARVDAEDGALVPAWVVVVDTPYYALTDDSGHFRIDELAPGTYDVTFWQAPLVTVLHGKLAYGSPIVAHRTMTASAATPGIASVILGH